MFIVLALAHVQQPSPASALTGLCENTRCAFPHPHPLFDALTHAGVPQGAVTSPGPLWVEDEEEEKNGQTQKQSTNPLPSSPCET